MNLLCCRFNIYSLCRRYKSKNTPHWTNIEKKNFPKFKALEYFDDFYATIYGAKLWRSLRLGLLCNNKYCAVINNYSEPEPVMKRLEDLGALNMRTAYNNYRKLLIVEDQLYVDDDSQKSIDEMQAKMDKMISEKAQNDKFASLYGHYEHVPLDHEAKVLLEDDPPPPEQVTVLTGELSLTEGLKNAHIDYNRIIDPTNSHSSSTLYEFIPATKIIGVDNWITEAQHLDYYRRSLDFPINVEADEILQFPQHLNVYVYEKCNITSFPSPNVGPTGVLDYYLLDGGSVVPVLALDLKHGDKVLDMCCAPGGKALTALQTLMPEEILCNDSSESRANRIRKVFDEYLYETGDKCKFKISVCNGVTLEPKDYYNKILVDVPCTNDRFSVSQNENNYFDPKRVQERLILPSTQSKLLCRALEMVPVGGIVVYSTCSLSPVQNDGVVQMSLKNIWNDSKSEFIVKDIREAFKPLNVVYNLGTKVATKYGILVLPHLTANFGPMYISKIERIK